MFKYFTGASLIFIQVKLVLLFSPPSAPSSSDPCELCDQISEKFIQSYKKTARSNFGGGNSDWEEKKLKDYTKSETRLIEIMENSCTSTESKCTIFLEKYEEDIENWYNNNLTPLDEFFRWFCIDTAKVCCSDGTFGKNCRSCQYGDNHLICSGYGTCDGSGTRSGTGRCICDDLHSGTNCSNCKPGYTKTIDNDKNIICNDIDECKSTWFLSPCLLYECENDKGTYRCTGKPFYQKLSHLVTLLVLVTTALILMWKQLHTLVIVTCLITITLVVLFSKHIL